jgi:hypothetical protein
MDDPPELTPGPTKNGQTHCHPAGNRAFGGIGFHTSVLHSSRVTGVDGFCSSLLRVLHDRVSGFLFFSGLHSLSDNISLFRTHSLYHDLSLLFLSISQSLTLLLGPSASLG